MGVLFVDYAQGQQREFVVSGYVRDSVSGEPLVGVSVMDRNQKGTSTNSYGFYSITHKAGSVSLKFSYIGYHEVMSNFAVTSDTELNIAMSEASVGVSEVLVRVRKPRFADAKTLGRISVNSEQLEYVPSFLGEKDILNTCNYSRVYRRAKRALRS